MVRRFYNGPNKVTAMRYQGPHRQGAWIINTIAETIPVNGYFYDKPGEYLGTVTKQGRKWIVQWKHDHGNLHAFATLGAAVDYMIGRQFA